jgi:hypothetical protein
MAEVAAFLQSASIPSMDTADHFLHIFLRGTLALPLRLNLRQHQRERYVHSQEELLRSLDAQHSIDPQIIQERARIRERLALQQSDEIDRSQYVIAEVSGTVFV